MENNHNKTMIKKGLKLYLKGKKLLENKDPKSKIYFKKSMKYLQGAKSDKYKNIILETETECKKILSKFDNNLNLFKLIEEGKMNKILDIENINFEKYNEDGLTPLHYCIKIGDFNCLKIFLKKGGKIDQINSDGNTLLEFSCLEKDPNAINFILENGGNMKKHLFFRSSNPEDKLRISDIDMAIISKIILKFNKKENNYGMFDFIFNYFDENELVGISDYNMKNLVNGLYNLFKNFDDYKKDTYINILKEELKYQLKNKIYCPSNKKFIIYTNLVPFIKYNFNITSDFLISKEIKYLIIKLLKKYNDININLKEELMNEIWVNYIDTGLFKPDYLGIITNKIISKINL